MTMKQKPYGALLVAVLACCAAFNARADAGTYDVAMTVTTPGGTSTPRVQVRAGEPFKIAMDDKGVKFVASFVLTAAGKNTVKLDGAVECGKSKPAHPVLITGLGETAMVRLDETGTPGCELAMIVSKS